MTPGNAHEIVDQELVEACKQCSSFHSALEGYAVILEEVEELWEVVKIKPSIERDKD